MGIPKFYRYISERYPCVNQIVDEEQIPEFDNCYLDMNGIIHNCSHPCDISLKMDEKVVFKEIFKYIDLIFHYIKPKKVFFMAIDGVAPRAKMNQQRGRRFRTAEATDKLKNKMKTRMKLCGSPELFDSNCITPGTVFMDRLHTHLKYFIVWKLSTDPLWQRCEKIIYSGHKTPGEGEHKIMDYIRFIRSQPDYDINTRHCLYGLDADLIILGLSTHEIHFTLFREEVRYNHRKRIPSNIDEIQFYLFHISLLRCYLYEEFVVLKDKLPFLFDLESIIDDWILFLFLIGNDFIPNLPNFVINYNSIGILCGVYKDVLPKLKGYINNQGVLNFENFRKFINELSSIDKDKFEEYYDDMKYMKSKTSQKMFESCEEIDSDDGKDDICCVDDNLNYNPITDDDSFMLNKFKEYKTNYYSDKLEMTDDDITPEFLKNQAKEYIKAIQWNLHYYYDGVCSWSWFYPQHYAPYISDIKEFSDISIKFDLGIPFKQFEQLLSVLPASSRDLLPIPYQYLMIDKNSPIIDYYPKVFETDQNGKLNDWEAIVRIPFIDEKKLFDAMKPNDKKLNDDEKNRNDHGPFYIYSYSQNNSSNNLYEAPEGFPNVVQNKTIFEERNYDFYYLPREKIFKGLLPGANAAKFCPGFPTLNYIKFTTRIEKPFVRVHEQKSLYENMILNIKPILDNEIDIEVLASKYLGKLCYVFWPFLKEALVIKLSTISMSIELSPQGTMIRKPVESTILSKWLTDAKSIEHLYHNKYGINLNFQIFCLVYVKHKRGFRLNPQINKLVTYSDEWSSTTSVYPLQLVVWDIPNIPVRLNNPISIVDVFQPKDICYFLGFQFYGSQAIVQDIVDNGLISIQVQKCQEPNFKQLISLRSSMYKSYMPASVITGKLSITPHLFSKICGVILIRRTPNQVNINERPEVVDIGLNMRSVKLKMWTPEFVVYSDGEWYYSEKLYHYVIQYIRFCPTVFKYIVENIHEQYISEEECFLNSEKNLDEVLWFLKGIGKESWAHEYGPKTLLTEPIIHKLEKVINQYNATYTDPVIIRIKPELLFKYDMQSDNIPPDANADFQIFDRVINISLSNAVPYGFKGTVIGKKVLGSLSDDEASLSFTSSETRRKSFVEDISNLVIDVLFDNEFVGAVSINGSSERALKLRASCLINISYGKRNVEKIRSVYGPFPVVQTSNISQNDSTSNDPRYKSDGYSNKLYSMSNKLTNNITQENNLIKTGSNVKNPYTESIKLIQKPNNIPEKSNPNMNLNRKSCVGEEKIQSVNVSASENLKKLLKISINSEESSKSHESTISNQLNELCEMQSNETKWKNLKQASMLNKTTNHITKTDEDSKIDMSDVKSVLNEIVDANTLKIKNDAKLPNLKNVQIKNLSDLESSFKGHYKEQASDNNLVVNLNSEITRQQSNANLIDNHDLHKFPNVIKNSEASPVVDECNTSQNINENIVLKKRRRILANIFNQK